MAPSRSRSFRCLLAVADDARFDDRDGAREEQRLRVADAERADASTASGSPRREGCGAAGWRRSRARAPGRGPTARARPRRSGARAPRRDATFSTVKPAAARWPPKRTKRSGARAHGVGDVELVDAAAARAARRLAALIDDGGAAVAVDEARRDQPDDAGREVGVADHDQRRQLAGRLDEMHRQVHGLRRAFAGARGSAHRARCASASPRSSSGVISSSSASFAWAMRPAALRRGPSW